MLFYFGQIIEYIETLTYRKSPFLTKNYKAEETLNTHNAC